MLAVAFSPNWLFGAGLSAFYTRKLVLEPRTTGHADPMRDRYIAMMAHSLISNGTTRAEAFGEVAEIYGFTDPDTVRKIYDRDNRRFGRFGNR